MKTSFWTKLLDLVSPRFCVSCGRRLTAEESALCPSCWLHLPTTDFPSRPYDNPMARLFWGLLPLEKAVSWFYYEPQTVSGSLIYALKYYGRADVAEQMGQAFARQLAETDFFSDIDVLVPVPLTRGREWQRGYNQSLSIARGIGRVTGLPIASRALVRTTFSGSQTHQSAERRRENVEHAFRLKNAAPVAGRHVLLIDDVVTTGSTPLACSLELLKAGDTRISILSLGFTR